MAKRPKGGERPSRLQILSLTGGGYLGLFSVRCISDLEQRTDRQLRDSVDFFAGTSIGGIVALALAAGVPIKKIDEAFHKHGPQLFRKKQRPGRLANALHITRNVFKAPYRNDILKDLIDDLVDPDRRLGDLDRYVLVPAFNLNRGKIVWFRNYDPDKPEEPNYEYADARITDIALATSAAPTYFRPHDFQIDRLNGNGVGARPPSANHHVDGGVFANCPDLRALHEATSVLGFRDTAIHMLGIGTTTENIAEPTYNVKAWGLYYWLTNHRLTDLLMAAQQQNVLELVRGRLGDHYARLDTVPSPEEAKSMGLDIAGHAAVNTIDTLAGKALSEAWDQEDVRERLQKFASHDARGWE